MKIISVSKSKKQFDVQEIKDAMKNYTGDRLKGGLGDRKNINDFSLDQIKKGVGVESEHVGDLNIILEIVSDHLTEDNKYYEKLDL